MSPNRSRHPDVRQSRTEIAIYNPMALPLRTEMRFFGRQMRSTTHQIKHIKFAYPRPTDQRHSAPVIPQVAIISKIFFHTIYASHMGNLIPNLILLWTGDSKDSMRNQEYDSHLKCGRRCCCSAATGSTSHLHLCACTKPRYKQVCMFCGCLVLLDITSWACASSTTLRVSVITIIL